MPEPSHKPSQGFKNSLILLANTLEVAFGLRKPGEVAHEAALTDLFKRLVVLEAQRCNLTADLIKLLILIRLALGIPDAYILAGVEWGFKHSETIKLTPEDTKEDTARLMGIMASLAAIHERSPALLRVVQTYLAGLCSDHLSKFRPEPGAPQAGTC